MPCGPRPPWVNRRGSPTPDDELRSELDSLKGEVAQLRHEFEESGGAGGEPPGGEAGQTTL